MGDEVAGEAVSMKAFIDERHLSYVSVGEANSALCRGLSASVETWILAFFSSMRSFLPKAFAIFLKVLSFQKCTGTPVTPIQKGIVLGKFSLVKGS